MSDSLTLMYSHCRCSGSVHRWIRGCTRTCTSWRSRDKCCCADRGERRTRSRHSGSACRRSRPRTDRRSCLCRPSRYHRYDRALYKKQVKIITQHLDQSTIRFQFSVTWNCVSLPRSTTSSDLKWFWICEIEFILLISDIDIRKGKLYCYNWLHKIW